MMFRNFIALIVFLSNTMFINCTTVGQQFIVRHNELNETNENMFTCQNIIENNYENTTYLLISDTHQELKQMNETNNDTNYIFQEQKQQSKKDSEKLQSKMNTNETNRLNSIVEKKTEYTTLDRLINLFILCSMPIITLQLV